jgi:hypothetical protein
MRLFAAPVLEAAAELALPLAEVPAALAEVPAALADDAAADASEVIELIEPDIDADILEPGVAVGVLEPAEVEEQVADAGRSLTPTGLQIPLANVIVSAMNS